MNISGLPWWLRHYGSLLGLGINGALIITLLAWRHVPWYGLDVTQLIMPSDLLSTEFDVVPVPQLPIMSKVLVTQLHGQLLQHFAGHSADLNSDFGEDWLVFSFSLAPQQLSLLGLMPAWPGWQLQYLSLQPKAGRWSLQGRWQPVGTMRLAKPKWQYLGAAQAFDVGFWQLTPVTSLVTGMARQTLVEHASEQYEKQTKTIWRYVGYVQSGPSLDVGAWLRVFDNTGSAVFCFVHEGDVCQGWVAEKISKTDLFLNRDGQRQQLHYSQSGSNSDGTLW
ncbi:MAG: hypothetical protein GY881_11260 [Gammaproteobacteria bacterium]|nr:hypothetical protein [Gammaproteobacteria bacterium]MDP6164614.1 hypothetical protein [Gammaproteobacteria bacterium]